MKTYNISQLKTNISQALRLVKKGEKISVLDRETPVALLVPLPDDSDSLKIRHPLKKNQLKTIFSGITFKDDIQEILLEDRNRRK